MYGARTRYTLSPQPASDTDKSYNMTPFTRPGDEGGQHHAMERRSITLTPTARFSIEARAHCHRHYQLRRTRVTSSVSINDRQKSMLFQSRSVFSARPDGCPEQLVSTESMLSWDGKYEIWELNSKGPALSVPKPWGHQEMAILLCSAETVDARPTSILLKDTTIGHSTAVEI